MSEAYSDALAEQAERNIWSNLREEAAGLSTLERTTLVADVAGIFDPSPTSDAVGTVLSLAQGDLLGAGLSVLGMVPYVGDLGKIGKIAKVAPRTARALDTVLRRSNDLAGAGADFLRKNFSLDQVAAARQSAMARVRRALDDAHFGNAGCRDCARVRDVNKPRMPQGGPGKGAWDPPNARDIGSGKFHFEEPVTLPNGQVVDGIEFRNGFPNFDNFVEGGKHELWEVTGDVPKDSRQLRDLMRADNPSWTPPDDDYFVLHHFEDGQVGYVPRVIHDTDRGGVAHTGGRSITQSDLF